MEIQAFPEAELAAPLRARVAALNDQAWPSDTSAEPGHDPLLRPVSMLLLDGEDVVAALAILSKELVHGGWCYAASGLSSVVTDIRRRGNGYGRVLVSAARAYIADSGADLAIFTCDRPLGGFYESAGWTVLPGAVIVGGTAESPFASDQFDKVTLASFFSAAAIRGAPTFENSRIELYPGLRDKLW